MTSGPDAVPAAQTTPTTKLNNAVNSLASKTSGSARGAAGDGVGSDGLATPVGADGVAGGSGGDSGGGGGGGDQNSLPNPPDLQLPGGGGGSDAGGGQAGDAVNNTVNGVKDVLGGVNNNVSGLLGQ